MILPFSAFPGDDQDHHPLEPIDTSSPRGTLLGFLTFMGDSYANSAAYYLGYFASDELFPPAEIVTDMRDGMHYMDAALRTLDVSALPPATQRESARRLAIMLKEVLDRLALPHAEAIPDAAMMARAEVKRWTIPGSEIRLSRIESGPRLGEYLFDQATVARLPDFYNKIKNLPYRDESTQGWYEFYAYRPVGVAAALHGVVPPRWILQVPEWARERYFDQPLWRWLGTLMVLMAGYTTLRWASWLARRWSGRGPLTAHWAALLRPLSLVITMPLAAAIMAEVLKISGPIHEVILLTLWGIFFLALTWATWVAGGAISETLIAQDKLLRSSIDSQLIRLTARLMAILAGLGILILGADRLGLPAYSVLAGLGISSVAVALAAQQTLSNLLGSLIIMFEKPFAIGNKIKVGTLEGKVEDVGFRSTRIRTTYNSLVTIPSSMVVSSTIDNMTLRQYRQVKTVLNLTYGTSAAAIEDFVSSIEHLLRIHPDTKKDEIKVVFHNFGPSSLDILVDFLVKAPDTRTEILKRQGILIDILKLAEAKGVNFAFPTQTLHIESWPEAKDEARATYETS